MTPVMLSAAASAAVAAAAIVAAGPQRRLAASALVAGAAPVVVITLAGSAPALLLSTAVTAVLGWGHDTAAVLTAVVAAPLVEEAAKLAAVALLVRRRPHLRHVLVAATAVGVGFAGAENLLYVAAAGDAGTAQFAVTRAVLGPLGHASFALVAAVAWSRSRDPGPAWLLRSGLLFAVVWHAAFNVAALVAGSIAGLWTPSLLLTVLAGGWLIAARCSSSSAVGADVRTVLASRPDDATTETAVIP